LKSVLLKNKKVLHVSLPLHDIKHTVDVQNKTNIIPIRLVETASNESSKFFHQHTRQKDDQ